MSLADMSRMQFLAMLSAMVFGAMRYASCRLVLSVACSFYVGVPTCV